MTQFQATKSKRYGWLESRRDETTCIHGRYIGYPGGPDYLCGYCEDSAFTHKSTVRYELVQMLVSPEGKEMISYPVNMHGDDAVWYGWDDPFVIWDRIKTIAIRDQQLLAKHEQLARWSYWYVVEAKPYGWWE